MGPRGIPTTLVAGLATQVAVLMMPATMEMYEALPRPEEVEHATTVRELQRYLTSGTVYLLQWMAMLRIAEIGGDEAVDALYEFYQRADSSCGDDSGELPKAGAVRLLGRVGGVRAKSLLLNILEYVVEKGPTVTYARPQLSPLGHQLYLAAVDGLTGYWQDEAVYDRLCSLVWSPPGILSPGNSSWAEAALLKIDMKRAGVDTLSLEKQAMFLLERVKNARSGCGTMVGKERWAYGVVVSGAVAGILSNDFGSRILPLVEEYIAENDSLLDSKAKAGLEGIMRSLRVLVQGEELRRQEIERARESLSRPGTRLVVKEDARGKWMEAVPVDTSAVEPDRGGEDEGWRQFFLDIASRPHSTSRDRAWAYRALALTAAKAGQWGLALEYYEKMEKEDYEHAFTTEVDIAKEKEALRQRRYPGP